MHDIIQSGPAKNAPPSSCYGFIKYWPIFQIISLAHALIKQSSVVNHHFIANFTAWLWRWKNFKNRSKILAKDYSCENIKIGACLFRRTRHTQPSCSANMHHLNVLDFDLDLWLLKFSVVLCGLGVGEPRKNNVYNQYVCKTQQRVSVTHLCGLVWLTGS